MSDESQVSDDTSTPDEAQSILDIVPNTVDEAIDTAMAYEPLGTQVEGTTHVETVVGEEPAVGDSEHYVESPKVESPKEASFWDTTARPPFILSFVDSDHHNGGFVIGWDTCGACNLHLRTCECKNGPEQPKYVKQWRPAADTRHDKPKPLTQTVKKAVVAADPQVVEKAVQEVLTPPAAGRKKRSDAGQPRGPRKKAPATTDSVQEAAGDLSAAMSKEK